MPSGPRRIALAAVATACLAPPSGALEKVSVPGPDGARDGWVRATTSCQVAYYNQCNGWVWVWRGWEETETLGVRFSPCCPGGFGAHQLMDAFLFFQTGAPSGYGFTGTLDVWTADGQGCPTGPPLRSSPFLPATGTNHVDYSANPVDLSAGDFVLTITTGNYTVGNPLGVVTDHPAAGATGPAACGLCYPTTRAVRSFYFGTAASPLCPGETLDDLLCSAELLWDVDLVCATPVEGRSWGRIKELYR
jgi:hypothetical protein